MANQPKRQPLTNKKAIIEDLHDRLNGEVRKHQIESIYNHLIAQAFDELKRSGSYRLGDLGALHASFRPARQGRNPRTGEPMTIAAGYKLQFKPGQAAKRHINA